MKPYKLVYQEEHNLYLDGYEHKADLPAGVKISRFDGDAYVDFHDFEDIEKSHASQYITLKGIVTAEKSKRAQALVAELGETGLNTNKPAEQGHKATQTQKKDDDDGLEFR